MTLRSVLSGCRGRIAAYARRSGRRPERWIERYYWVLLGRGADPVGRATFLPQLRAGAERDVIDGIVSSDEFRARYTALSAHPAPAAADHMQRAALARMGSDAAFVELVHRVLLARPPHRQERRAARDRLRGGAPRSALLHTMLRLQEFRDRYAGPVPEDHQLCELANPAKWDNAEWIELLRALHCGHHDKAAMHRKVYEYTQTLFGLRRLGVLGADASVLGVGAGHEPILYWLANHVRRVVATDLYGGRWQSTPGAEADDRMLHQPEAFAPFAFARERLIALCMDGRHLAFRDASFDAVYSLSSIEHFGDWAAAKRAVDEMSRVLKPGGVLALATEWRVSGPPCAEVFSADEVHALIAAPELALVEPIDDRVWQRYRAEAVDLRTARNRLPHMLVRIDDTVFTSVMLFLRKASPASAGGPPDDAQRARRH